MAFDPVSEALGLGRDLIARLWPDPEQRAKAEAELLRMHQEGDLEALRTRLSAIVMEAKSQDPWTSRARPSFLYVMYIMILGAIPMGVVYAIKPDLAAAITAGVQAWLAAIPTELWALFGTGYLGYVAKRSDDKARLLGQEVKQGLFSKVFG